MARENLMNSAHKTSNEIYRSEYDRIFKKEWPNGDYDCFPEAAPIEHEIGYGLCRYCHFEANFLPEEPCCSCEALNNGTTCHWKLKEIKPVGECSTGCKHLLSVKLYDEPCASCERLPNDCGFSNYEPWE